MTSRKTVGQFILEAQKVHGDKYDYSKVKYVNCDTKVEIVCPIHGLFMQTPYNHSNNRQGCPQCARESLKTDVLGFGVNDLSDVAGVAYRRWRNAIVRCYSEEYVSRFPTYKGCSVCDEWRYFSNFKRWFDQHYVDGWCLDKDILVKGNKVYSPDTCCFVPNEINMLLNKNKNGRGKTGVIGVVFRRGVYIARLSKYGQLITIGNFDDKQQAFDAYKTAKEAYIKEVANKWKDKIEYRVYNALLNYEVEITD